MERRSLQDLAAAARAPATRRAYAADVADFRRWCAAQGQACLPADAAAVAAYLADCAGRLKPATIERRLAAIIDAHRGAGHALDPRHPLIADVRAGIRRTLGTAPAGKQPLACRELADIVAALPPTLAGRRDRCLLLLGFAAALRRSELAALDRRDVVWMGDGSAALVVRRSKEDQVGAGAIKAVGPGREGTCPVRALKDWLIAARLDEGPLFRRIDCHGNMGRDRLSGAAVALIVKRAVARAGRRLGWSPSEIARRVAEISGHSLRIGFVQTAAQAGMTEVEIMAVTGHTRSETVRRYARLAQVLRGGVTRRLGL